MLLGMMSCLYKGIIFLILTNSEIGIISKEGNNHDIILNLHVHIFLWTPSSAWVSDAQLKHPLMGTVVISIPFNGHSLGFSFPGSCPA